MTSSAEWAVIIVLIIVVLVLAGVAIWYFFIKDKGQQLGQNCNNTDLKCDANLYCSGANTCQSGAMGNAEGQKCSSSAQCEFNLTCNSKTKLCTKDS